MPRDLLITCHGMQPDGNGLPSFVLPEGVVLAVPMPLHKQYLMKNRAHDGDDAVRRQLFEQGQSPQFFRLGHMDEPRPPLTVYRPGDLVPNLILGPSDGSFSKVLMENISTDSAVRTVSADNLKAQRGEGLELSDAQLAEQNYRAQLMPMERAQLRDVLSEGLVPGGNYRVLLLCCTGNSEEHVLKPHRRETIDFDREVQPPQGIFQGFTHQEEAAAASGREPPTPFPQTPGLPTEKLRVETYSKFLAPNEHDPGGLSPHLPVSSNRLFPRTNLISVGTERVFMGLALHGNRLSETVGVDIDPSAYLYNMANVAAIHASKTREAYLQIRREVVNGRGERLREALSRAEMTDSQRSFYEQHFPEMLASWKHAHQQPEMRALDRGVFHRREDIPIGPGVPEAANYLHNDAAFANVKRAVDSGRLSFRLGPIDQLAQVEESLQHRPFPLCVDVSNVPATTQVDQSLGLTPDMAARTRIVWTDPSGPPGRGDRWTYHSMDATESPGKWEDLTSKQEGLFQDALGTPREPLAYLSQKDVRGSAPIRVGAQVFPASSPEAVCQFLASDRTASSTAGSLDYRAVLARDAARPSPGAGAGYPTAGL